MNYKKQQTILYREKTNALLETMPSFCSDYVLYCRGTVNRSELTIYNYMQDINVFFYFLTIVNPDLTDISLVTLKTLDNLIPQDIYQYMSWVSSYKRNDKTFTNEAPARSRKLSALRSFMNYLYGNKLITNNAAALCKIPTLHKKKLAKLDITEAHEVINNVAYSSPEALSKRSLKLAQYTKYRDYAILSLLLGTGIRVSELVGLDVTDIDFKHSQMKVIRKGGNEDIVELTEDLVYAINEYICQERDKIQSTENALFLSSQAPYSRLTTRSVERLVKKFGSTIPSKKVTPHTLRRSFGTALYNGTGDIYLTAQALGDASVEVVSQHYVETSPTTKAKIKEISLELTNTDK